MVLFYLQREPKQAKSKVLSLESAEWLALKEEGGDMTGVPGMLATFCLFTRVMVL